MTEAQVIRANPSVKEARAIAEELHALIQATRERYVARPDPDPAYAFELEDAVDAVRRTVLNFWPTGKVAAGNEGAWVMEQLTRGGRSDLYDRYLRLCELLSESALA
jgi:predicted metal-dependent HD superfamily phosphohydrolase